MNTAIYLKNRSPTVEVEDKTPYEVWTGIKPNIKHLRIFGSTCYALIPKETRSKLDAVSQKGILLGYDEQRKGYRIYFPDQNKAIVSRDVIFDEIDQFDESKLDFQLQRRQKKLKKKSVREEKGREENNDIDLDIQKNNLENFQFEDLEEYLNDFDEDLEDSTTHRPVESQ